MVVGATDCVIHVIVEVNAVEPDYINALKTMLIGKTVVMVVEVSDNLTNYYESEVHVNLGVAIG